MKHPALLFAAALVLSACSGGDSADDARTGSDDGPVLNAPMQSATNTAELDGFVTITVDRLIEEDAPNCLVMMQVANGTNDTVAAGLFAFNVVGDGDSTGGNMFPQTAEPGQTATAQVILMGKSCDMVQTIQGGEVQCRTDPSSNAPGSCIDDVRFGEGAADFDIDE